MKLKSLSPWLIALVISPTLALADEYGNEPNQDSKPKPPPHQGPLFRVLDADKDGKISADEISSSSEALKELDSNRDGVIDQEELRPGPPPGKDQDGAAPPETAPAQRPERQRNSRAEGPKRPNRPQHPDQPQRPDGPQRPTPPQRPDGPPPEGPPPGGEGEQGDRPPHPPVPPLLAVLDADHDGKISEKEIESAPESLKKLDHNQDGELTQDELRPPHPPRPQGPPPEEGSAPEDGEETR